jgi:hypothetical protein
VQGDQDRKSGLCATANKPSDSRRKLESLCQLGYAVGVVFAVSEYPTIRRTGLSNSRKVFAVIGYVACNPTLQMVGTIGGENFASGEIVSKMFLHSMYLSFFGTIIIPQNSRVVNT